MATKKPTKKNISSKKASPKRTSKKSKAKAPEAIIIEESKGIYTLSSAPDIVNPQITDAVTQESHIVSEHTNETNISTETPAAIEQNTKVDNSDLVTENVSYNNMIVPQAKDNTILYIGVGLGVIIFLWALFA